MATTFKIPKTTPRSVYTIDEFLGVDFTNSAANIDDNKSPNAVNMIRDVPGKVRKRMGYEVLRHYAGGGINGYHYRRGDAEALVHVGTYMYKGDIIVSDQMNDAISKSWQFNDNLYIIDGKTFWIYNDNGLKRAEEVSYIPTITIAKAPTGGGTQYEEVNLIQSSFIETFLGTENDTNYYLTFGDLDDKPLRAWILDGNGEWQEKTWGVDFGFDRTTGAVFFVTPPGKSPLTGEDNVKIQASRKNEDNANQINKCTIGTRFGVNGAFDRLFLSGNPDHINADWYSQQWDATYFPDMGYSQLGSSKSAIVGYSIISNYLAAHKDEQEQDLSIILRQGDLVEDKPSFKIINTLQGAGAIAPNSFSYLSTEPLFLTRNGLYAVTAQDITGEKYAQSRSFYLNGKLKEVPFETLKKAFSLVYNDMYLLAVGESELYILDGLQPIRTDKSEPYSTRQYVGFYCLGLPIRYMFEKDNRLYFGTSDGRLCRFFNDKESQLSYNDNGTAIYCCWETPDIDGNLFYKNKTVRYLAARVGSAISTSIEMWAMVNGIWNFIKKDNSFARYLSFTNITFSKFSFSTNKTQKVSRTKMRIKKVDKYRLRFVNGELNEPFALYNIGIEYVENGNYKG